MKDSQTITDTVFPAIVQDIDHLGIISSVIDEIGLVKLINGELKPSLKTIEGLLGAKIYWKTVTRHIG